jgi:hypothetical protein
MSSFLYGSQLNDELICSGDDLVLAETIPMPEGSNGNPAFECGGEFHMQGLNIDDAWCRLLL